MSEPPEPLPQPPARTPLQICPYPNPLRDPNFLLRIRYRVKSGSIPCKSSSENRTPSISILKSLSQINYPFLLNNKNYKNIFLPAKEDGRISGPDPFGRSGYYRNI